MPDNDFLDEFPLNDASSKNKEKGKGKKKAKPSKAFKPMPIAEITDDLPSEEPVAAPMPLPLPQPPAEELSEEMPEEEPVPADEFAALPVPPEVSPWERFLTSLAQDLLRVLYDCGLTSLELLQAQTRSSLLLPMGKLTERQVTQLEVAMRIYGWTLALEPVPEVPDRERTVGTQVQDVQHGGISQEAQQARNHSLLRKRLCM
jgi:hypothetical protein